MPESPRNHQTNVPGLYAIGECDYHYHGGNRLGANSLLSCIFTGLFVAPCVKTMIESLDVSAHDEKFDSLHTGAQAVKQQEHNELLHRSGGKENPYVIHQQLGDAMQRAVLVVRNNKDLTDAYDKVCELAVRASKCSLSDTGNWTNQNIMFTKSLIDMFWVAKALVKGALQRDECRGAHYKPEFSMAGIETTDPAEQKQQAEAWCDAFEEKNRKWLKSTIATFDSDGELTLSYEDVDTSLIPPRPRLYGMVGGEAIVEAWKRRKTEGVATAS